LGELPFRRHRDDALMASPRSRVSASVVIPIFNEAASLPALSERLEKVLEEQDLAWEVIFVDDGSSDETFEEIEKLHAREPRYKCVRFARNFGSHVAISAGLEHCFGDIAIVMTADLEEPPEKIPDFLAMWRKGYHLIWGIRSKPQNQGISRFFSLAYHKLFSWLASMGPGQAEIGGGFFLADARVLDAVRQFPERNRSIIGLLLWAGFKQGRLTYDQRTRQFGSSKWNLSKKLRLALDTFVGFSNRPLRLMFGSGFFLLALAPIAFVLALSFSSSAADLRTAAYVVAAVSAIVGFQLVSTGLLGEYVARSLDEGRRRPLYVVMDKVGIPKPEPKPNA